MSATAAEPQAPNTPWSESFSIPALPCPKCGNVDTLAILVQTSEVHCMECDEVVTDLLRACIAGYRRLLSWAASCPKPE